MAEAKTGDTVRVHYTGTLADGTVFDSSEGRDPLEFTLGAGMVVPGFEKAVLGMVEGEKSTNTIVAAEAYGDHKSELMADVPKDRFPDDLEYEVGTRLQVQSQDGRATAVVVAEINDDSVKLDGNHPLAGKDLTFEIELVEIKAA